MAGLCIQFSLAFKFMIFPIRLINLVLIAMLQNIFWKEKKNFTLIQLNLIFIIFILKYLLFGVNL